MNSYVWPNYFVGPTFQSEVNWLKAWISDRANWLDENLPQLITSAEDNPPEGIGVFPNPVVNSFEIKMNSHFRGPMKIQIFNTAGVMVEEQYLAPEQNGVYGELLGNSLAKGVYIYRIFTSDSELRVGKVFKR